MTMRDQFAAAALAGLLMNEDTQRAVFKVSERERTNSAVLTTQCAYEYADAMLKAREVKS